MSNVTSEVSLIEREKAMLIIPNGAIVSAEPWLTSEKDRSGGMSSEGTIQLVKTITGKSMLSIKCEILLPGVWMSGKRYSSIDGCRFVVICIVEF